MQTIRVCEAGRYGMLQHKHSMAVVWCQPSMEHNKLSQQCTARMFDKANAQNTEGATCYRACLDMARLCRAVGSSPFALALCFTLGRLASPFFRLLLFLTVILSNGYLKMVVAVLFMNTIMDSEHTCSAAYNCLPS